MIQGQEKVIIYSFHFQATLKKEKEKEIMYILINLNYTWLMILDKPIPNACKKMAGSIDIKEKARRTNELLAVVESTAIPT